jgi:peptidoglycan hydrolase-like protein with peptidoglycan-binding domain
MRLHPAAATARTGRPHPATAARPPSRSHRPTAVLLSLQRTIGNAAVSALLQRQAAPPEFPPPTLSLPDFVGLGRLETAARNDPPVRRDRDPRGPAVYAIQKVLIKNGIDMPGSTRPKAKPPPGPVNLGDAAFTDLSKDPDGIFGQETFNAVTAFQTKHQLHFKDGRVGPETLTKMEEVTPRVPQKINPPGAGGKVAGVESFTVKYDKDTVPGRVAIQMDATFKDDATHDPAKAEVQQFVSSRARTVKPDGKVTADTGERPFHDDNYHRGSDRKQTYSGATFTALDQAGFSSLSADENLDFRFTAEQRVVDLESGNILASRGPHTVTVKGPPPCTYKGAPLEL